MVRNALFYKWQTKFDFSAVDNVHIKILNIDCSTTDREVTRTCLVDSGNISRTIWSLVRTFYNLYRE